MAVQEQNYTFVLGFEQDFEQSSIRGWMDTNWISICSWATAAYLVFIFSVQSYMKDRQPFGLRTPLMLWSLSLALFSIIGACRVWPEFIHTFYNKGLYSTVCVPSFLEDDHVTALWTWFFVLSKLPELVDTVFIVLRKQQLIFLHWYHHVTVLWFAWYSYVEFTATCRWFMVMNYSVHALMYSYYAVKALKIPVPKVLAMVITSLQLLQMVFGCGVNILAWRYKANGRDCAVSTNNLYWSFLMYTSYFMLFARFFYLAYFVPKPKVAKKVD
eukprot:TRINITY_DN5205_c0_g1_i1.p1 TRINITY_DN5205_c0_g1~~TRINITY_DN5205_c0_g1_i1.p1  ORF type:complete len:286 (-),score=49.11 TRINITY_DN5205_c0_g1_i1:80-892(-)